MPDIVKCFFAAACSPLLKLSMMDWDSLNLTGAYLRILFFPGGISAFVQ